MQSGPTVALIGLGRVGAQAPTVRMPDGREVFRNHLEAVYVAGGRISALVDRSVEQRREARAKCPQQAAIAEAADIDMLTPGSADIVTIATPPSDRQRFLNAALTLRPKAILMEKPLADDIETGAELVRMAATANVPVFVAYNRRTDPGMNAFVDKLAIDQVRHAVFYYSNGLLNYASHAVDSILAWFGPVQSVQAMPQEQGDPDRDSVSFHCRTTSGLTVDMIGLTGVRYDMFEADIFLTNGRVGYRNNGAEKFRYEAHDDLYYPGYPGLVEVPQEMPRPIGGFVEMYRTLFAMVETGQPAQPLCTLAHAFEVQRVLTAVVQSAREKGRIVSIDSIRSKSLDQRPRSGSL